MTVAHIFVSGHVQGVWFRESMREQAEQLRVTGWVQNLPDGRVEAIAAGDEIAVERLIAWAGNGPPDARVDGVELGDAPDPGLPRFEVRR